MNPIRPAVRIAAQERMSPRELVAAYRPEPDSRTAVIRNALSDKSGLGTLSGVTIAAALTYMAVKSREKKLLAEAVRKGLPVKPNVVAPAVAFTAGAGTGVLGKLLWDRYNNRRREPLWR